MLPSIEIVVIIIIFLGNFFQFLIFSSKRIVSYYFLSSKVAIYVFIIVKSSNNIVLHSKLGVLEIAVFIVGEIILNGLIGEANIIWVYVVFIYANFYLAIYVDRMHSIALVFTKSSPKSVIYSLSY